MKKIIISFVLFIFVVIILLILILSTLGVETNKFNKLITNKAIQAKNINLNLNTIKFKIDPKELSLFLETQNPKITYRGVSIPVKNVKLYIDFLSILKSDPILKKTSIKLKELDIKELNKLSIIIKPSNFKSLLNNKIQQGKLISEIEIFLTKEGLIENFIAKGSAEDLKIELLDNLGFKETSLNFFADKNDILIKNIFGKLDEISISDGDLKLNLVNGIRLSSNFNSKFDLNKNFFKKFLSDYKNLKIIENLKADLNNNLFINFDNTYKIEDFNYSVSGDVEKGELNLLNPIKNNLINNEEIKRIYLSNFKVNTTFKNKKINLSGEGKYSFDDKNFFKLDFENLNNSDTINLKANFDYEGPLTLNLINYQKTKNSKSNIILDFQRRKDIFTLNNLLFKDGDDLIQIKGVKFIKNQLLSFKEIKVLTSNNDFLIQNKNKILINGNKFDATNLVKFLNKQGDESKIKNISNNIEIDFKIIKVPMSETLQNFKLIGEIQKGQFIKISSKGDFGGNNFLDISMKKEKNSNRKFLEIYSDLTRPLLTEFSFFKGLSGGKLLFTSIIEDKTSNSKLKIENFKVVNAPGVIQLLSLADLGGLADLAEGEGLSFDLLEIDMEKSKDLLKLNEILALGPSMSVLMEGFQDKNGVTSLRGTLVPAKTLNKIIAKIPVIGKIVIPKEVGEGLFGISFKMKGPKGKIKTTINPIRTLTPRFLQKIIDKNKTTK